MKHTPGPWRKHSENRMGGYEIVRDIPGKGSHLLVASTCETSMMKGEPMHAYSDACLIAAAPELLVALQGLLAAMEPRFMRTGVSEAEEKAVKVARTTIIQAQEGAIGTSAKS